MPLYALCQLTRTHRDSGGKPSGARAYYPPLRFPQSTLDDSGHNRYGPMPMLRAMWLQSAPTQGCQELSHTGNDVCGSSHTWQFPVLLLTQCTWAPTKRHSSPVEVVLTGSRVALPGPIEIFMGPCWGHGAINQG